MLELHEIKHVFGLPGETTIGWYKYWRESSDIEFVLTRDERTASMPPKLTQKSPDDRAFWKPLVLGLRIAPGITEAFLSSVPVIYFSSDIPINQDKSTG